MWWNTLFRAINMGKRVNNSPGNEFLTRSLESNPTFVRGVHKFNSGKKRFW